MSFNTIHYAVQIETNTNFTDSSIGHSGGIFRFITGSPSGVLTYEGGAANNYTWYSNFIMKDGLSNPKRSVDISKAGDYGTLSNFNFKITNSSLFWAKLKSAYNSNLTTNMNLIGSIVKLYSVINNVFYQIWTGSITELPRTHKEFSFVCEDAFVNKYHKDMPSGIVDGKPLPQLFGSGNYVKVYNSGTVNSYPFTIGGVQKDVTVLTAVGYSVPITKGILLTFTNDTQIPSGSLVGKFVKFIQGGTYNATIDEDQYLEIKDNYYWPAISENLVVVDNYFKANPPMEIIKYSGYQNQYILDLVDEQLHLINPNKNNNVFFSIVDTDYKYYVSNNDITINDYNIYSYDENLKQYLKTGILINSYSGNYLNINYNTPDISGEYTFYSNVPYTLNSGMLLNSATDPSGYTNPSTWTQLSGNTWTPNSSIINSMDQRTFDTFTVNMTGLAKRIFMRLDLTIDDIPKEGDIYILPDMTFSLFKNNIPVPSGFSVYLSTEYHPCNINNTSMNYDLNEDLVTGTDYILFDTFKRWAIPMSGYYSPSSSGYNSSGTFIVGFNCPNNLYDNNFFTGSGLYIGPETTPKIYKYSDITHDIYAYLEEDATNKEGYLSEYIKVPEAALKFLRNGITNKLEVYYHIYFSADEGVTIGSLNQVVTRFHGLKVFQANTTQLDNNIYVNATASNINGINSNSVYGAFKTILEVNDSIPSASINYGNLALQRGSPTDWVVGRQINQKQNSLQYLQELCQQSYVCIFPTRDGKIKLNSWMDETGESGTFNDSNIIRDSLKEFKYTQMKDIYNDFNVNYDLNYANNDFEQHLFVTNTERSAFPASTGNWNEVYTHGISDYSTAKNYWDNAHSGYLLSQRKTAQPSNLQNLYWYNKNEAAKVFIDYCIRWTSNQHINTSFDIPLNSGNIQLDITNPISLSNELYTNNVPYSGYITGIEYNLKDNSINLEAVLDTNDYDPIEEMLIIEMGSAPTIFSETGSAPTTIIES